MIEYFKKFWGFIKEKKIFFIWFLFCFLIDRITTHIVLSGGQFGEYNSVVLAMRSVWGYAWSEILTILFISAVFFYVGVFGGDLTKKIVLPAFCLIYTWMMLGNIIAVIMEISGNYDCVEIFAWISSLNWLIYCFILSAISTVIVWIVYKIIEIFEHELECFDDLKDKIIKFHEMSK